MKTIIQIGTNDGLDEFKDYCIGLEEKYRIVLVEANSSLIHKIKESYDNLEEKHEILYVCGIAIVPDSEEESHAYLRTSNCDSSALGSIINRNSYHLNEKSLVPTKRINEFIKELNVKEIEELHIDTEGLDYELLLSLDINKYNIKKIVCEIWPFDFDDADGKWRTGPSLMNEIENKYSSDYEISETVFSSMKSLKFIKK